MTTISRANTSLIRPRSGAPSFVMRIHIRVVAAAATMTMIDATPDSTLFFPSRVSILSTTSERRGCRSTMSTKVTEKAMTSNRSCWWAASFFFLLQTRVYTALLGRFSHSFVCDAILSFLSLSLSFLRSLLGLSFSVSRNSCTVDGSPLLSRCNCLPPLSFTTFRPSLFLSLLFFLSLLLSSYLAHPRSYLSLSLSFSLALISINILSAFFYI